MFGTTRAVIKTYLETALDTISSGYTVDRLHLGEAIPGVPLPNIVYKISEDRQYSEGMYMHSGRAYGPRLYEITIEAREQLQDGIDYKLDDLCYEIETAIMSFSNWYDIFDSFTLISTTFDIDDAEYPFGKAVLTYNGIIRNAT